MARNRVLLVVPVLAALALTAGARESGGPWANGGDAGRMRADGPSTQPGASQSRVAGGAAVKIVSQGVGRSAPGAARVKVVQRSSGPGSFRILGQGAGQPGTDRKPAGVGRGPDRPRMTGEGSIRPGMGWKGATVGSKKNRSDPAPAVQPTLP